MAPPSVPIAIAQTAGSLREFHYRDGSLREIHYRDGSLREIHYVRF